MTNRDRIIKAKQQGKVMHVGGPVADSQATLCLYADEINLPAISARLGIEPTQGVKRGDIVGRRNPARIGLWSLEAPENLSFEEKLQYLLPVTTKEKSTWDSLALTHSIQLRCTLFLHSWTEGFDLSPDVVAEIGNRHWTFGLAVYSAEGDEIVDAFLSDGENPKEE